MEEKSNTIPLMTFGGHLKALKKMLFRILIVILLVGIAFFCFKEWTFKLVLSPGKADFITYTIIEKFLSLFGTPHLANFHVELINTELATQFMIHISTSFYLALLAASPYILFEAFRFISPALYEKEKKYSKRILLACYFLFIIGVLIRV